MNSMPVGDQILYRRSDGITVDARVRGPSPCGERYSIGVRPQGHPSRIHYLSCMSGYWAELEGEGQYEAVAPMVPKNRPPWPEYAPLSASATGGSHG